jgi:5-methylthioadenosine/S-adenosylhomocysteine deaminase
MLTLAVKGGARVAGMANELGCLAAGRLADIILVDVVEPDHGPDCDPRFVAANSVVGRDVRTVIVDGRVVMRDREMLTVDVEAVKAKIAPRLKQLMERFDGAVA